MISTTSTPALSHWPTDIAEESLQRSVCDALPEVGPEIPDRLLDFHRRAAAVIITIPARLSSQPSPSMWMIFAIDTAPIDTAWLSDATPHTPAAAPLSLRGGYPGLASSSTV